MKIELQKNWSEQFIYGDETPGFFVGRGQEIMGLRSVLKNNDSSTILVSSVRGIGKTSFVHKTLSGMDCVDPVFVNMGHTFSSENFVKDNAVGLNKDKKLILKSLIRAIRYNKKFENDKELNVIYEKSLGQYKTEKENFNKDSKENVVEVKSSFEFKNILALLFVLFITLGVSVNISWVRLLLVFFGSSGLFLSFSHKTYSIKTLFTKENLIIDDSTEYLEIEFENWLKFQKQRGKRIVFVIDELDKIDQEQSFKAIKEYKNLFTRSCAHFIFISSEKAFELVNESREDENKGIFPTFFTQVFYLPLPSTCEIKEYLDNVLISNNEEDKIKKEELIKYLLFTSGNDFFELKKLIGNIILFENDDKLFIYTDQLRFNDLDYNKKTKLFDWIDKWFLIKNRSQLKINWKNNSDLQKTTFAFLNKNYPNNFTNDSILTDDVIIKLKNFLVSIGHYKERDFDIEDVDGEQDLLNTARESNNKIFYCTGVYNREDSEAVLTEEDKGFQKVFNDLIGLANDLDRLPNVYMDKKIIDTHTTVVDGADGIGLSGISLHSIFETYKYIFNSLEDQYKRINITSEKVKSARKSIEEQIENVKAKYFEILNKLIEETVKKDDIVGNFAINSDENSIRTTFESLPELVATVSDVYGTSVWCKPSMSKYVLLINNFEDESHITKALEVLRNNKNILIINIESSEKNEISHPKVYKDAGGKKRSGGLIVSNFINFKFNNFKQYTDLLVIIEKHLN